MGATAAAPGPDAGSGPATSGAATGAAPASDPPGPATAAGPAASLARAAWDIALDEAAAQLQEDPLLRERGWGPGRAFGAVLAAGGLVLLVVDRYGAWRGTGGSLASALLGSMMVALGGSLGAVFWRYGLDEVLAALRVKDDVFGRTLRRLLGGGERRLLPQDSRDAILYCRGCLKRARWIAPASVATILAGLCLPLLAFMADASPAAARSALLAGVLLAAGGCAMLAAVLARRATSRRLYATALVLASLHARGMGTGAGAGRPEDGATAEVLRALDRLLGALPEPEVRAFLATPAAAQYLQLMERVQGGAHA